MGPPNKPVHCPQSDVPFIPDDPHGEYDPKYVSENSTDSVHSYEYDV